MPGPLHGYTVLELGRGVAAGYCGRLLAGFGATVIKVEPPGGDDARRMRVVPGAPLPNPEAAPAFLYLGMGKRSLLASPDAAGDAARLRELARGVQAVIVDRPPARLAPAGLDYDSLSREHPSLVYTAITPFGAWGPAAGDAAENITVFALGGQMSISGEPDREPLCTAGEQGWYQAGLHAFAATTFALLGSQETGLGQFVDISAVECMAGALEGFGPAAHFSGMPTPRTGKARFALMGIYPVQDGYAGIFTSPGQVPIFAKILDRPDIAADPRLQTLLGLVQANDEMTPIVEDFFNGRTKAEIQRLGRETTMTIAPVASIAETAASVQLAARDFFVELPAGAGHSVRVPGPLFRMSATPWQSRPAPRLGELGWEEAARLVREARPAPARPRPARPGRLAPPQVNVFTQAGAQPVPIMRDRPEGGLFAGLRVLDFTAYWAGPYTTKWLADFGAEVIKVEPVNRLDLVRNVSQDFSFARPYDVSAYFNDYARGKLSIGVDPAQPLGKQAILDLIPHCDIVVENFKAGRMQAIGLGYDVLRTLRPDLIMVSISGYGQDGPDAGLAGVGTNMEQLSGLASLNVYSDAPQPYNSGIAYGDPNAGCAGAAAVAMALLHRNATGAGQYVDISGLEGLVSLIGEQFTALSLGLEPRPKGNRHPDMAPHGCYPCESRPASGAAISEDRWVTIAVQDDAAWQRLCRLIEREDLAQYRTLKQRRSVEHDLDAAIMGWTVLREDYAAARELQAAGIAAAPVLTPRDLPADPQLRLRGYFETVDDPDMGPWPHDGVAWRLSRTPGRVRGPAPRLAEHTRAVLANVLGYSAEQIDELYRAGAAGSAPARG
ncbi:MAG TPA: CoA transferase [Dehalococcoidia bacterium]|nr:CoA transferase [Dehalococcoidia bacterium]